LSINGRGGRRWWLSFPYDGNKDPKPLGGANDFSSKPAGGIETKRQRIARLRAKQAELNSMGGIRQEPGWHIRRLADLAEIERELKALAEEL
jgi:hypothetical protein